MTPEQATRLTLGWSREELAAESGLNVASVYLIERIHSAGSDDDALIREALAHGLARRLKVAVDEVEREPADAALPR